MTGSVEDRFIQERETRINHIGDEFEQHIANTRDPSNFPYHCLLHFNETRVWAHALSRRVIASGRATLQTAQTAILSVLGHDLEFSGDRGGDERISARMTTQAMSRPDNLPFFEEDLDDVDIAIQSTEAEIRPDAIIRRPKLDHFPSLFTCDVDLGSFGLVYSYFRQRSVDVIKEVMPSDLSRNDQEQFVLEEFKKNLGRIANIKYYLEESSAIFPFTAQNGERLAKDLRKNQRKLIGLVLDN